MLLVACFRNCNLQLQIVGIAVIPGEKQDDWDFFLRFLTLNLDAHPHFLISNRDKGLILAAAALDTIKIRCFCFRHLMEKFSRQFMSKHLKHAERALALAVSEGKFAKKAAVLKRMNPEAEAWLMGVGKDKWSLCYSPCPQFGALTPNNVESVNSALKKIRKLPILDCLMAIERYLGTFIVTEYVKRDELPFEFAVQLFEPSVTCICGYAKDMGAPRVHSFASLRKIGKLGATHQHFDKTWTTSAYNRAYKQVDPLNLSPPVLREMLTAAGCAPPE